MLVGLIVATVLAALVLADRPAGRRSGNRSPAVDLLGLVGVVFVNQVLFTVYVLRVHGGDPSFVAKHLPDGWFDLADHATLDGFARWVPRPELLAPTVLRVHAFLELPIVVFAYLTVCRWFSADVYRRALALVGPVAVAYSATFCLIEWRLYNPYTVDDTVIRLVAAVVVPIWAGRLSPAAPNRPHNLAGLLLFVVSGTALGVLLLVVYDTALLYNLGHLDAQLPVAVVAALALAAARWAVRVVPDRPPGRGLDSIARSFGWLLVMGFLPALPIRYGLNFGAPYVAAAGLLVIVAVALARGVREAFYRCPGRPAAWLLQMAVAACAGVCASAASLLLPVDHTENRLLWAAALFFVTAATACALLERSEEADIVDTVGVGEGE